MRSNGRDWSRHQGRTDVELIADDVDFEALMAKPELTAYEKEEGIEERGEGCFYECDWIHYRQALLLH